VNRRQLLTAELTWYRGALAPGLGVWLDPDGRIERVGPAAPAQPADQYSDLERVDLPGLALLPGFVSAHSHAFQRGLRGRGESFPAGAGSFWTWREAMYELVESLTPDSLFDLSRQAFFEMRRAGITTVGEFHYLHHVGTDDFLGDEAVLAAAKEAGVRLVLLQVYYRTGGIGGPLQGAQRRFETASLGAYWNQMDHLAGLIDTRTQSLAVAAHSLRAVPLAELTALLAEARRQGLPFHLHLEEQRQEIEECQAAYGKRPMELLLGQPGSLEGVTAVHCTHTRVADLRRFVERGGRVCACPLTEANLGDGIPNLHPVPGITRHLCLGTDSNTRISMLEEMRWLEYGQRLKTESRGLLKDDAGEVAPVLLRAATRGGAEALGVITGEIEVGRWGDLVGVAVSALTVAPVDSQRGLASLIGGGESVAERWIGAQRYAERGG
jgi:formimidoylglutamate deiminase